MTAVVDKLDGFSRYSAGTDERAWKPGKRATFMLYRDHRGAGKT
jgi:hypothetical protein